MRKHTIPPARPVRPEGYYRVLHRDDTYWTIRLYTKNEWLPKQRGSILPVTDFHFKMIDEECVLPIHTSFYQSNTIIPTKKESYHIDITDEQAAILYKSWPNYSCVEDQINEGKEFIIKIKHREKGLDHLIGKPHNIVINPDNGEASIYENDYEGFHTRVVTFIAIRYDRKRNPLRISIIYY